MGCNLEYLKSFKGPLKVLETLIGLVVLCLALYYNVNGFLRSELFLDMTAATFTTGTFVILVTNLISSSNEEALRQTLFESVYNVLACILYLAASIALLIDVEDTKLEDIKLKDIIFSTNQERRDAFLSAGSLGLINGVLYLVSSIFSIKELSKG